MASIRQLKDNVDGRCRIDRLSVTLRRLEPNLLSGANGIFIQSVTESFDHVENPDFSGCRELHPDEDFTFELQFSSFVGVLRFRLGENLNRCLWRSHIALFRDRWFGSLYLSKGSLLNLGRAASAASISYRSYAISKSCAGDRSPDSFRTSGSIPGTRPRGQIERTQAGNVRRPIRPSFAPDAIWISEAPCLNLTGRKIDRRFSRASGREDICLDLRFYRL